MTPEFTIAEGRTSDGRKAYRFDAGHTGVVWAIVSPVDAGRARVDVAEETSAISSRGESVLSDRTREMMRAARNRFGVRRVLGMMRYVVASCPDVHEWVVDRISGANRDVQRTVRV